MKDFIAQAFEVKHKLWRYIIGTVVIFIFWQLGNIPFVSAVSWKLEKDGLSIENADEYYVLANTLNKNLTFFLMMFAFVIAFLGIWLVKYMHRQNFLKVITSRKRIDVKRFMVGFGLAAIMIVVINFIDYIFYPDKFTLNFNLMPFLILAIIALIMVPIQTTFEEIYFRGYLMQGLGVIFKNRAVPFMVSSLAFGALHVFNPEFDKIGGIIMVSYIGTGFLLAIITLMDEGLELPLGLHAGNNLITALLVTSDWTAFQTESIFITKGEPNVFAEILVPVLLIYPIYLIILAKIYKWNNWRHKLFGKVYLLEDN